MRPPPWLESTRKAATPDEHDPARREVERWERMDAYQGLIAGALRGASVAGLDDRGLTPSGVARLAVVGVELECGAVVAVPDARGLREDWAADPAKAHAAVSTCAQGWAVRRHRDGAWRAGPISCGSSICPLCVSAGIADKRRGWLSALETLARRGYHVVLLTRTRPADVSPAEPLDVVWTEADRARWGECPWPTHDAPGAAVRGVGAAVPGETLGAAWDALSGAWRDVLDSRVMVEWQGHPMQRRTWWARSVVASLDCTEATQVLTSPDGRVKALRWHVHGHAILVLDPKAIDTETETETTTQTHDALGKELKKPRRVTRLAKRCAWWRAFLAGWTGAAAGSMELGQDAVLVSAADDMSAALREVIKYPGKLAEMSQAGIVEWLATAKGRRPHRAGGTLHGATRRGRVARLGRLLDRWRDLSAMMPEGPADERAQVEALTELDEALTSAGWDGVSDRAAHVEQLGQALAPWEARHAADVHEALTTWDRLDRAEQLAHGWAGDCYQAPREELGEQLGTGRLYLLTWERLGALLRAGLRSVDDLRLVRGVDDGEDVGRVDLRAIRRAVRSWEARSRERGD